MKRIAMFICIMFVCVSCSIFGGDRITKKDYFFEVDKRVDLKKSPDINLYQFVNGFYEVFIYGLGLDKRMSSDDITAVISTLYSAVNKETPATIAIKDFKDKQTLRISVSVITGEKGQILLMLANYNAKTGTIIKSQDEMKDAYAKGFYLIGNRLVRLDRMYDADREKELMKGKYGNNLADFYLFDEIPGNDAKAKDVLLKDIRGTADASTRFLSLMTLGQYYLIQQDIMNADTALNECEVMIKSGKMTDAKLIVMFNDVFKAEHAITKAIFKSKR